MASLVRQSLPKCHPDIFDGDATLFHPWKRAFEAMIHKADVSSAQEINYLRMYTSGDVQRLVDNYRKRHYNNPATALHELWTELGRRFGNTAAITNELIERLNVAAKFKKGENAKLQKRTPTLPRISHVLIDDPDAGKTKKSPQSHCR